jgi:hypothetical protein
MNNIKLFLIIVISTVVVTSTIWFYKTKDLVPLPVTSTTITIYADTTLPDTVWVTAKSKWMKIEIDSTTRFSIRSLILGEFPEPPLIDEIRESPHIFVDADTLQSFYITSEGETKAEISLDSVGVFEVGYQYPPVDSFWLKPLKRFILKETIVSYLKTKYSLDTGIYFNNETLGISLGVNYGKFGGNIIIGNNLILGGVTYQIHSSNYMKD